MGRNMKYNKYRKLGNTSKEIFPIGLGAMSFTDFYGNCEEHQAAEVLNTCLDLGVNHIDTANVYGMGLSEERIGNFLSSNGQSSKNFFSIATKASIHRDPDTGERSFNNEGKHLESELDKSLKRLGVECVDLFYIHRRDNKFQIEEVVTSLSNLIKKGKTKSIGFSEIAPSSLIRASKIHQIDAVQSEYSLSTRSVEMGLLQTCKQLNTSLVAFSPVGRTLLTDRPLSFEAANRLPFLTANPRFLEPNYSENIKITNRFRAFAKELNVSSAALSIAWLLSKGEHVIPIPGTRSKKHLEELVAGTEIDITSEIINKIEEILPIGWAHGERYSKAQWIGPELYC